MKTKFFTKNKKNKIEFTEIKLKELLDEIYNDGYNDGYNDDKSKTYIYTTPYRGWWWNDVYYTTTTATSNIDPNKNNLTTNTTSNITLSDYDNYKTSNDSFKWTPKKVKK